MKFALCFSILFVAVIAAPVDDPAVLEEIQKQIMTQVREIREDFFNMHRQEREYEIEAHETRKLLIAEIDVLLSKQQAVEKHITDELAKNPGDMVHKWQLETELDAIKVLGKHVSDLEKRLKAQQGEGPSTFDDVYADDLEAIQKEIRMKSEEARKELFAIIHMTNVYEHGNSTTKDEEKKLIIAEIDKFTPKLRDLEKLLDSEIAKKNEDPLHMWILETERDGLKVMDKHLVELETKFKAEKTFDDVYADEPSWEDTLRTIGRNAMEAYVHFQDLLRKEREHDKMIADSKAKIIADIDKALPKLKNVEKMITTELAKKHEHELLNWALQSQLEEVKLIETDLAKLEQRLKTPKTN